jgi:hypothetical protein
MSQHMDALAKANEIRLGRGTVKQEIRAGETSAAAVLLRPPECVETMELFDLLMAQPRWGPVRCRRLVAELDLPVKENIRIGVLTQRQRQKLAVLLTERDLVEQRLRLGSASAHVHGFQS